MSNGQNFAEILPAGMFICDECGTENWVRFSEAPHDMRPPNPEPIFDLDPDIGEESGRWMICPSEVTCIECNSVFSTDESYSNDGPDDSEEF